MPFPDEINGYDIWYNHFKTVVYLHESMRFLEDPEWGYELSKVRKGIWSEKMIDIINDRYLETSKKIVFNNTDIHSSLLDTVISLPDFTKKDIIHNTVFATPSNTCKQAINNIFTYAVSKSMPDNMLPIRVVADFWGQLDSLSIEDKKYVMGLDESKFGRLAPFLDLVIGMPIMVTQNEEPLKGIANGTFGILEDIQFPPETNFKIIYDDILDIEVLVPNRLPLVAWIKTTRGEGSFAPPVDGHESLHNRKDLFPIYPRQPWRPGPHIKLSSHESRGQIRYLKNLKITQLPIIPCTASTIYKLQGETLKSEVIVDWISETRFINKRQQAYLMLSRCTTRYGLITLNLFTNYLAKWFVPDQDVLEEDDRLKKLSDTLINELEKKEIAENSANEIKIMPKIKTRKHDISKLIIADDSNLIHNIITEENNNNNNNIIIENNKYFIASIRDNITNDNVGNNVLEDKFTERIRNLTDNEINIINRTLNYQEGIDDNIVIINKYVFYKMIF